MQIRAHIRLRFEVRRYSRWQKGPRACAIEVPPIAIVTAATITASASTTATTAATATKITASIPLALTASTTATAI